MAGALNKLAAVAFNVLLVIFTFPAWIMSLLAINCNIGRPLVAPLLCVGWRIALACSCWIPIHVTGLQEYRKAFKESKRPVVLLCNHTSFMDTLVVVTCTPILKLASVRMFVSNGLFKIPAIRSLVRALKHLSVPFKATSSEDQTMTIDTAKMAERMQELEDHIRGGGAAGWYPEGKMNRGDLHKVDTFRAGGMAPAVHHDAEIWLCIVVGTARCWPASSPVGGFPSRIGVTWVRLTDSTQNMLAAAGLANANDRDKQIHLANAAQTTVQSELDKLVAAGYSSYVAGAGSITQPLMASA